MTTNLLFSQHKRPLLPPESTGCLHPPTTLQSLSASSYLEARFDRLYRNHFDLEMGIDCCQLSVEAKVRRSPADLTNGEVGGQMTEARSGRLNIRIEDMAEKTDMNQVLIAGGEAAGGVVGSVVNLQ